MGTAIATQYTVEDAPTQSKYAVEDETPPPQAQPEMGMRDKVLNFFRPLSADERSGIEAHLGKVLGPAVEGVANTAMGITSGVGSLAFHPLSSIYGTAQTAADALNQLFPDVGLNPQQKAAKDASLNRLKTQWEDIKDNPDYALGNLYGGILAGKAAGEAVGPVTRKLAETADKAREGVRTGAQSLTGAGERVIKEQVKGKAQSAGEAAKTTEEGNRAALKAHDEALKDAGQKNVNAHVKHLADKAEAEQANAAAKAIPEARAGLEGLVKDKVEQADVLTEKARHDALEEGNKKYSTVNGALNPIQADPEVMNGAVASSLEALKGSKTEPTILRDMQRKLDHGDQFTYEDLQGDYSRLGRELSKGTLPGDEFHAYDVLHETIGDEMQRIADGEGMGEHLKAAREYWRRMKQTFGKPFNRVGGRAAEAVKEGSPEYIEAQEREYQHRLLGSFNPEIPKLLQEANAAREQLAKLPTEGTRPKAEIPKYPEEKTVEPPKTKPIDVEEVNTRAMREHLVDQWAKGESSLSKYQVRSLVGGGLGTLVGYLMGGAKGAEALGVASYVLGPSIVAKIIESGPVREWLTRPPAGELDTLNKLPYADRIKIVDGLNQVARAAKRKGVEVNPAVTALIAASGVPLGPKTKALRETADDFYAKNPR